jgi:uncharacterized FlaG/YvyC family protein
MSNSYDLRVEPTAAAHAAQAVQAARLERPAADAAAQKQRRAQDARDAVASVGGQLRSAYAQYVVNPDTHDVVVRIRDAATDEVLSELPSPEVQAVTRALREYAETLARLRIASQSSTQA